MRGIGKRGVDTVVSLFTATILVVLLIVFFTIFALLLLVSSENYEANFFVSDSSLTLNIISFLQRTDTSELKNWEVIASPRESEVAGKFGEFVNSGENDLRGAKVFATVLKNSKNPLQSGTKLFGDVQTSVSINMASGSGGVDYSTVCSGAKTVVRMSEIYIPQLNKEPKKMVVCVQ